LTTLNASSYSVGIAELYFAETVVATNNSTPLADPTSFGNITVAELTPDTTYVDHFISVKGDRRKDKSVAVTKSINISFTFDEMNDENIRRFVLGSAINAASQTIVMDKEILEGRAVLNFQTDVGNNFIYVIPSCNLKSDGGIGFTSEDWMSGNFILEVLYNDSYNLEGSPSTSKAPFGYIDFDWSISRLTLQSVLNNTVNCWNILTKDNQQPSLSSNAFEGSTTNSRLLPFYGESNANTSAVHPMWMMI